MLNFLVKLKLEKTIDFGKISSVGYKKYLIGTASFKPSNFHKVPLKLYTILGLM